MRRSVRRSWSFCLKTPASTGRRKELIDDDRTDPVCSINFGSSFYHFRSIRSTYLYKRDLSLRCLHYRYPPPPPAVLPLARSQCSRHLLARLYDIMHTHVYCSIKPRFSSIVFFFFFFFALDRAPIHGNESLEIKLNQRICSKANYHDSHCYSILVGRNPKNKFFIL